VEEEQELLPGLGRHGYRGGVGLLGGDQRHHGELGVGHVGPAVSTVADAAAPPLLEALLVAVALLADQHVNASADQGFVVLTALGGEGRGVVVDVGPLGEGTVLLGLGENVGKRLGHDRVVGGAAAVQHGEGGQGGHPVLVAEVAPLTLLRVQPREASVPGGGQLGSARPPGRAVDG